MGVTYVRDGRARRLRQGYRRMFAYSQEVGKGMYIGGDDPNHHHHEQYATPATDQLSKPEAFKGRDRFQGDDESRNYDSSSSAGGNSIGKSEFTQHGQRLQWKNFIDSSASSSFSPQSSSSSSLSSFLSSSHSNQDNPKAESQIAKSPISQISLSELTRAHQNATSFHPVHLAHPRDTNHEPPSFPASSSNTNLLNQNTDQILTIHPPLDYRHRLQIEPFPTALDAVWNLSDSLCSNRSTTGTYDCWDIFNPDDNATATDGTLPATDEEYRYWTLLLIVIPLLTVFGNVLVVMSVVKERSLKTVTNYFICSLAVADIMVAVVVMPFAVYMEVMNNRWTLNDGLCDAWVASDVLGCTASILNLTAICVDRFIAVTQPIKYAKHKNSKRVFIMLAITWVISVAIAAPIALGVNYSEARNAGDCQFFNSDFIIYSSMGSFYIPSLIMCFLYSKIYRVIRLRAQKAKMAKKREVDKKALQGIIENPATVGTLTTNDVGGVYGAEATVTTGLAKIDNGRVTTYNTTKETTTRLNTSDRGDENHPNSNSDDNSNDDDDEDTPSGSGSANNNTSSKDHRKLGVASVVMQISPRFLRSVEVAELITNPVAEELERLENQEQQGMLQFDKNGGCVGEPEASASTSGGTGQTCANEAETPFTSYAGKADPKDNGGVGGRKSVKKKDGDSKHSQKKGVTKFNFHVRVSRKRKEKSSSRREKKATKTLAIVLGVFLVCWVPFFTLNIMKAICIRYDLNDLPACRVDPIFFSLFQWLGYINSFLNPVIYTIFNQEFRKAFRKILTDPCS